MNQETRRKTDRRGSLIPQSLHTAEEGKKEEMALVTAAAAERTVFPADIVTAVMSATVMTAIHAMADLLTATAGMRDHTAKTGLSVMAEEMTETDSEAGKAVMMTMRAAEAMKAKKESLTVKKDRTLTDHVPRHTAMTISREAAAAGMRMMNEHEGMPEGMLSYFPHFLFFIVMTKKCSATSMKRYAGSRSCLPVRELITP